MNDNYDRWLQSDADWETFHGETEYPDPYAVEGIDEYDAAIERELIQEHGDA